VVELLLGKGADGNAQDGRRGDALQQASSGGQQKVVELLLGKGTNVNERGWFDRKGADHNTQVENRALYAASYRGRDVVELLLGKGADVNAQGWDCGNALEAASSGCHEKVVELFGKGANIKA